jgi:Na+/H+ antiporter NhaC
MLFRKQVKANFYIIVIYLIVNLVFVYFIFFNQSTKK